MEMDCIAETLPVTETPCPALHALDAAIDALGMAIVHLLQSATHAPGQSAAQPLVARVRLL